MVKIYIDGNDYLVKPGNNLLHACLGLGFDIPYFCFHPALGSVGACRQCAVKKFSGPEDRKGRIIMSCMEPVSDGMIISVDDPEVKSFRASIIESLMTNHPHDCPVCDEGGECHLQDMTVMTGHNYRRFDFKKRTHTNQYLGPYIQHEMNRCIQCYRCVRFYRDYAGGKDLDVFGSGNRVYFGRHQEGKLESEFSGNLVEVCPTGVFTDKTLREHYTRKWDLTNSPSICLNCSVGCNIIVGERYGTVRRILSRYNGDVNGYFICDRGRFGYQVLNGPDRIKTVLSRMPGSKDFSRIDGKDLHSLLSSALKGKRIAGLGSPAASLESNFALETLVGTDNFFHGISREEFDMSKTALKILGSGVAHSPSLREVEQADVVLILGEDILKSAPMLALAVIQAARNKSLKLAGAAGIPSWNDAAVRDKAQGAKSPVFIVTPGITELDYLAEIKVNTPAEGIASFGSGVAAAIKGVSQNADEYEKTVYEQIVRVAQDLRSAENPLIITGFQSRDMAQLISASEIAGALAEKGKQAMLSFVFPECNSVGLGLMNGRPADDLPVLEDSKTYDSIIILENDLSSRSLSSRFNSFLASCDNVIVLTSLMNDTARSADIILPAGPFSESSGTIVSSEGRAQRYYRVLPENGLIRDSWKYIGELMVITGKSEVMPWAGLDEIVTAFTDQYEFFRPVRNIMPDSEFRMYNEKIARQTLRFSGRTSMNAGVEVSEPAPPGDNDSPLVFSMEGYKGIPPADLVSYYWSPGWNSVQAMNKYMDEPAGRAEGGNPGVLLFGGNMTDSKEK